jgi:hypothetical protein
MLLSGTATAGAVGRLDGGDDSPLMGQTETVNIGTVVIPSTEYLVLGTANYHCPRRLSALFRRRDLTLQSRARYKRRGAAHRVSEPRAGSMQRR